MELKGGDKLEKVLAKLGGVEGGYVNAGFMSGATYPNTGTPVASVAFWNEFGHGGPFPAPPRPFMRPAVEDDSKYWAETLGKAIKYYEYDANKALEVTGQIMVESIQEHINNVNGPELSKTTLVLREIYGLNTHEIRARDVLAAQELASEGYTGVSGPGAKPLNHTGHMIRSVDFEVKNA